MREYMPELKRFEVYVAIIVSILGGYIAGLLYYLFRRVSRKPKIFIGHSMDDTHFAKQIAKALRQKGIDVKLPEDELKIGDNIAERIRESIANSDSVVFLVSSSSLRSNWIGREIDMAQEQHLRIFPVLLDDESIENLPKKLQNTLFFRMPIFRRSNEYNRID